MAERPFSSQILNEALELYDDYVQDIERAHFSNFGDALERFMALFDENPVLMRAASFLPTVDFADWYAKGVATVGSFVGSGHLEWPAKSDLRLAHQYTLLRNIAKGDVDVFDYCSKFLFAGTNYQDNINLFNEQIVRPFTRDFRRLVLKLPTEQASADTEINSTVPKIDQTMKAQIPCPVEIQDSLEHFRRDYPDAAKVAFIMMKFGQTQAHKNIVDAVRAALKPHGIVGVRADDKHYHDDLYYNIMTYIFGCGLGVSVFERIEAEEFNPNVAFEVGYMAALRKPVCLLKDKTLKALQTDLIGKLYRPFDPQDPMKTIVPELTKWMQDKGIIRQEDAENAS